MKTIFLKSYGIYLNGREEGQAAFAVLDKEMATLPQNEKLFVDCSGVLVLAPSWCDEFFGEIQQKYPNKIVVDDRIHMGLKKSFEVVESARGIQFTFGHFG